MPSSAMWVSTALYGPGEPIERMTDSGERGRTSQTVTGDAADVESRHRLRGPGAPKILPSQP